jgi:hypothetical protein
MKNERMWKLLPTSTIVVKKGIKPCAVDENVIGIDDAQAPGISAVARLTSARRGKVGVIERCDDIERGRSAWFWLIVSS